MIITKQRMIKFQGYREGAFYILRPADIKEFRSVSYENLEKAFDFRKSSKDLVLYEKRLVDYNYIILRKVDFFKLKKESKNMDYGQTLKRARELDFSRTIDFTRIDTYYFVSPYIQERFSLSSEIDLQEKEEIECEYLDEYISVTPFFRCFNEIRKYKRDDKLYLYCRVQNETTKYELVFDEDIFLNLFRKYQHPDYEPFNLTEALTESQQKVQEEKEEIKVEIDEDTKTIIANITNLGQVSKNTQTDDSGIKTL